MISIAVQLIIGFLYAGISEWLIHKYILHGFGWKGHSFFISHWRHHHLNCRKYSFFDPRYMKPIWAWNEHGREVAGVIFLIAIHIPFLYIFPYFVYMLCGYGLTYLVVHRMMHINTAWGQKWFPWHRDHHMVGDQSYMWGVVTPLWDYILRSHKPTKSKSFKKG